MESFSVKSEKREMLDREKAEELLSSLKDSKYQKIKLSGVSFGEAAAEVAATYLQHQTELKEVDISDIIAGRPEVEALKVLEILTSSLVATNQITLINVSDNALGKKGINACSKLLANSSVLEHLYCNNDGLDTDAAELLAQLILTTKPTKLKTISIFNNLLRDGGAKELAKIIKESPNLEKVVITAARISKEGTLAIVQALENSTNLTYVDINDNTVDEEGKEQLAKTLSLQEKLEYLNISSLGLEDDGAKGVLKALKSDKLTYLNISSNEITEDAAESLAKHIASRKGLKSLHLEDNDELGEGVLKIVEKAANLELEELDISGTGIEDEVLEEVIKKAKDIKTLKKLVAKDLELSDDLVEDLKSRTFAFKLVLDETEEEPQKKQADKEVESLATALKKTEI